MEFKYSTHLGKITNCPPKECVSKELPSFRWMHWPLVENDFKPLSIIKDTAPRILETTAKVMDYPFTGAKTKQEQHSTKITQK